MIIFLWIVAISSYLLSLGSFFTSMSSPSSHLELVVSGVFAVCGTVAVTGIAILERMTALHGKPIEAP